MINYKFINEDNQFTTFKDLYLDEKTIEIGDIIRNGNFVYSVIKRERTKGIWPDAVNIYLKSLGEINFTLREY